MESSAEQILKTIELIYENVYNLLDGFQKATISNNENIIVPQKQLDGSIVNVTVNSFQKIQHELNRIDTNYQSLLNTDSISYTLESDGSISQNTKTSFMNAEFLSNFNFDANNCIVDKKLLEKLVKRIAYSVQRIEYEYLKNRLRLEKLRINYISN